MGRTDLGDIAEPGRARQPLTTFLLQPSSGAVDVAARAGLVAAIDWRRAESGSLEFLAKAIDVSSGGLAFSRSLPGVSALSLSADGKELAAASKIHQINGAQVGAD